ALGLCTEELRAVPFRKCGERRMRRSAHEIDSPVPQRGVGLVHRKNQFQGDVETFVSKEAKFDRCGGGKIGIGNDIGNGEFHEGSDQPSVSRSHAAVAISAASSCSYPMTCKPSGKP